ncbi:MAG: type VII secretion protein EccCa [Corynebacterium sp.]|uniref:type VII secretion protein EccCa n=1 Tax=Corynebacterium sp. TaxID=1720 RepID=UPI0026E01A25|nr:type VII secretion protein EccCa [Corynebacterium sp.]MDO5669810.1 type VII secretion protein EccCa [Corynebacterium sp.]
MSIRIVHRPARLQRSVVAEDAVDLAAVPTVRSGGGGGNVLMMLMPVVGGAGMVLMMMSSGSPIRMAVGAVMFFLMLLAAIAMFIRSRTGSRKRAEEERTRFLEHLQEKEQEVRARAADQQRAAALRNPAPTALSDVVRDPYRLWERRRGDEDFLVLRLGVGTGEVACGVEVRPGGDPMQVVEPVAQAHLERMLRRTRSIDSLPLAVPARGVVSLVGPPEVTAEAVRALLLQAAVFHAPDDLRMHLALPLSERGTGSWALWLPHLLDEEHFDGPIGRRGVSHDEESATVLLTEIARRAAELKEKSRFGAQSLDEASLLVVVDMDSPHGAWLAERLGELSSADHARVTVLATSSVQHLEPSHVDVRVLLDANRAFRVQLLDRGEIREPEKGPAGYVERLLYGGSAGRLDAVPVSLAESVARVLSPLRLVEDATPAAPLEQTIGLDAMLGIEDFATYDIRQAWAPRPREEFLAVPFAIDAAAAPVALDIKESAQGGMGPHGLCVGATGSGKSEVLRTIVLSQVVCHPPELLSLVLVDFKGGATFAGLESLPHTAAIVDNLEEGVGLVDRLHDSILGEIQRRQRVLQEAGNLANVGQYQQLRAEGKTSDPLPVLFVVIDEFGELLAAKPEFIDLFVQIGRIGRSIGIHLLLASQRLEEGRLRGLESYLSYRIGLRTFSAQESRQAIGTTDAHELPPIPGSGYLKVDPDIFQRFKAAYVSGTYQSTASRIDRELPDVPMPLELSNTTEAWLTRRAEAHRTQLALREPPVRSSRITLDLVVSRLTPAAERTRQIWLPPLPEAAGLEAALGRLELTSDRGLTGRREALLHVPLGVKDNPLDQWQGPMVLDLSGAGGNVAVLGAPQSGKTTVLRTLVTSLALTHTPEEVNVYILDMAGSALGYLVGLPHVGDVATRFDEDKLRRLIAEMRGFLTERERLFGAYEISSIEQMRHMHAAGQLPELPAADIFLVVDGWAALRRDADDLADTVTELAERGLGYGIHVVAASGRWADFKLPVQAVIGTRVEMELNDPIDSSVGRRPAATLKGQPTGRALTPDELYSQVSLPTVDQPDVIRENTPGALVAAVAGAWQGATAPSVRMLPDMVTYADLVTGQRGAPPALVGVAESTLQRVRFDLDGAQRHLFIVGDARTGKTSTLRTLISEIIREKKPGEVMFGVFDLRRGLLGFVPEPFLGDYAGTHKSADILTKGIVKELERRLPPADVTVEQLRTRSWWTGPDIYLVIDDVDMLEGSSNPLRPFVPFLTQAADLGLHVIVARRSTGMSRASYDPLIQGVREAGAQGLLLSGDRQEGAIWPKVYLRELPPGRAQWVDRAGRVRMVQLAYHSGGSEGV